MNRHLVEGELQALLDGELPAGERAAAEAHLAACGDCGMLQRELRGVNARARELLLRGDLAAPVAQAQMSLRSRRVRTQGWRLTRSALLKAAVLLLAVSGVAAAAVPGSPLRDWVRGTLLPERRVAQPRLGQAPAPAALPGPLPATGGPTGVSIRPRNGAVRVVLSDASPGVRVTARLVDAERAGVLARGHAVDSARFRTSPGRIEVVGAGAGEIEVELPRSASVATVEVNGRIYVAKEGDVLRVLAPEADASGAPEVRVGG